MAAVRFRFILLFLIGTLFTGAARADVMVLVHGWAANVDTWVHSGVAFVLARNGWHDAGVVTTTPGGVRHFPGYPSAESDKRFYRAQLPSTAPLLLQASHLTAELVFIQQRHPKEDLIVVGHSAGGVIARLALIRPEYVRIKSLVTIASPHLGTPLAFEGLHVVEGKPFFCPGPGVDFLKTVFGGRQYQYLQDSHGAMLDLTPAGGGNLIDWLNQQPHPDIQYHAIISADGDGVVSAASQDLNSVPALRGRAKVYPARSRHGLNPTDGELLLEILAANK